MKRRYFFFILFFIVLSGFVHLSDAQTLSSPFITKTYTSQDGLPHSYIYGIHQDPNGYLWVGTRYGLGRFDGKDFSSITLDDEVRNIPLGILLEDETGRLSILSAQEIYYLDNKKKVNLNKKGSYFQLFFISEKGIQKNNGWWTLANDSIFSLKGISAKKITPVPQLGKILCRQIFETDSGWYYNFLDDFLFAGKNGEIRNIDKLLPSHRFIIVMGFRNNQFYLYTDNGIYTYKDNNIQTLFQEQLSGKHIYSVYRDKKNRLWVGTQEDGVLISQPGEEKIFSYSIKLPNNLISGFYEDNEGNTWIADFEGLIKVQEKQFQTFSGKEYPYLSDLNLVAKDNKETVFFFSETNGFSNWRNGKFSFKSGNSLKGQLIDALCRDDKNRFWCISRQNKLILFDQGKIKFINDPIVNSQSDLQPDIIYDDYRKKVWVPGDKLLSGDENGIKVFKDDKNNPILNPWRILYMGSGKILVATSESKLFLIDRNNTLRNVSVPRSMFPEKIHNFFSDPSRNLWVSYPGTGLLQCSLLNDSVLVINDRFTRENGLNNDVIQSMTFDKQHRMWLSTMAGIAVIDLKNKVENNFPVYLFGKNEGIPASGLEYGRLLCDDNGDMWYSTQNSLMKFDLNEMQFDNIPPPLSIEKVELNMNETNWHKYSDSLTGIFQIPVNPIMNYSENTITIIFKAATMNNAETLEYSYMLIGLNNNWSNSSTGNTITFSKLRPGSYTFFVRARENNFDWSKPVQFSFVIRRPYWQQWWFTALMFLAGFAIIYGLYRFRISQLNKEKRSVIRLPATCTTTLAAL